MMLQPTKMCTDQRLTAVSGMHHSVQQDPIPNVGNSHVTHNPHEENKEHQQERCEVLIDRPSLCDITNKNVSKNTIQKCERSQQVKYIRILEKDTTAVRALIPEQVKIN